MRQEELTWMEDPSNAQTKRGQASRQIFPLIELIQGGATEALSRSARLLAYDQLYVESKHNSFG